jgi:hypothetical protein
MNHASTVHSTHYLVAALVAARNNARVRLYLLSLDARNHWYELESELDCLQSRIEYEGARMKPSAADKVRELTETVTEFLRDRLGAQPSAPTPPLARVELSRNGCAPVRPRRVPCALDRFSAP